MSRSAQPSPDQAPSGNTQHFHERLLPSPVMWLVAPAAGVVLWFMFSALHQVTGLLIALLGAAGLAAMLYRSSTVIQVHTDTDGRRWLQAGSARIEVDYLGAAEELDPDSMRQAMGPQLRTDAHVCHRPWVHTGVRIEIQDPDDPTPYWLVATRSPDRLTAALGRSDAPGGAG